MPDPDLARDRVAVERLPGAGRTFPRDAEFVGSHHVTVTTFVTREQWFTFCA